MYTNLQECLDFVFSIRTSTYKRTPLEMIEDILNDLGNPHHTFKTIHFAGSNGKGSTLNAVDSILKEADLQVGVFTSPHIHRVNERIRINEVQIPDDKLLDYLNQVLSIVETKYDGKYPTFFGIITIVAYMHFAEQQVDVALIETGIGGLRDSTNVITPLISVITTVSYDHTDVLGETIQEIASEKAGIIKPGVPVVSSVKNPEAQVVIRETAAEKNAPLQQLEEHMKVSNVRLEDGYQVFDLEIGEARLENIALSMFGIHQAENAGLAVTAVKTIADSFNVSDEAIYAGLKKAKWAGRFEKFGDHIVIDGAHNPEGMTMLLQTLTAVYPEYKYHFLYAALEEKDNASSVAMVDQVATDITFTSFHHAGATPKEKLMDYSSHTEKSAVDDWKKVITDFQSSHGETDVLVITGSLYFMSEVREYLVTLNL
ncbi:dihydrofolate synthase/folylpolyglutamate synthase [Chryseomicrobium aureum]|uniref:bifunctional folylpolyglutamate synthase/dihydrofolate synthase n=1 Tax=Chryseomicrobium aureum TaxID=1441723 RepID=UPI00195B0768|nr:folylpolyglutamate synthase/dihydrofolate synthase family protein [Chryseomicrobium aureum]MBM7706681.1 dihydrofolate synthase/folylpolyglutamate synthase [Chryseomicrobium aureum]